MQVAFFCCFRQRVAGMSRDLGRNVPDLEKLYASQLWADFSHPKKALKRKSLGRIFLGHQGPTRRDIPDPGPGMSWAKTLC